MNYRTIFLSANELITDLGFLFDFRRVYYFCIPRSYRGKVIGKHVKALLRFLDTQVYSIYVQTRKPLQFGQRLHAKWTTAFNQPLFFQVLSISHWCLKTVTFLSILFFVLLFDNCQYEMLIEFHRKKLFRWWYSFHYYYYVLFLYSISFIRQRCCFTSRESQRNGVLHH